MFFSSRSYEPALTRVSFPDVTIEFEESARKVPKTLEVLSNDNPFKVEASAQDDAHSLIRRWTLENEMLAMSLTVLVHTFTR